MLCVCVSVCQCDSACIYEYMRMHFFFVVREEILSFEFVFDNMRGFVTDAWSNVCGR